MGRDDKRRLYPMPPVRVAWSGKDITGMDQYHLPVAQPEPQCAARVEAVERPLALTAIGQANA
jgi:hypothetical protein